MIHTPRDLKILKRRQMFNLEIESSEIENFKEFENIEFNFSKSIEFNPKLNSEIKKVFQRTLNNKAKVILGYFHLNIFDSLEIIVRNTDEPDDFIFDLSEFIANYFDSVDHSLNIENLHDFEEFMFDLKLASIIMINAISENDMELIYESVYQLQIRLKKEKLIDLLTFNDLNNKFSMNTRPIVDYEIYDNVKTPKSENFTTSPSEFMETKKLDKDIGTSYTESFGGFIDVKDFKLPEKNISKHPPKFVLKNVKTNLNNKILEYIKLFEHFNVNYNRVFILGSLDYLRIVLREEKLNKYLKTDLFKAITKYLNDINIIYSLCNKDNVVFEKMSLNYLITHFNQLQNYISQDLEVLPRLDEDIDDSLFY